MRTVVVPFAGATGKTRLAATRRTRQEVSLAMLGDVLAATLAVGATFVVTGDDAGAALARELGAALVDDPGGGQGAAVAAALARAGEGAVLVVNADLPGATAGDLEALADAISPTSSASSHAAARARRRASRPREGLRSLGGRRRRPLRPRPCRRAQACRRDRRRQRRRRRRGARRARLARPRLASLCARRRQRRGARLGPCRRDVERARDGRVARGGGLVPPRRPRSRPAPRAHAGARRGRAALTGHKTTRACARRRDASVACDGRARADVDRHGGRRVPLPGMVRRPRASRRGPRRPFRGSRHR